MHQIDKVLAEYKRVKTVRPPGTFTGEEAAARWKLTPDRARKQLNQMTRLGIVTETSGFRVNNGGAVIACTYYKLVGTKATKKA